MGNLMTYNIYLFSASLVCTISSLIAIGLPMNAAAAHNAITKKEGWEELIFGPLGALALSLLGLYLFGRVIMYLVRKNDKLNKDLLESYKKRLEDTERELRDKK